MKRKYCIYLVQAFGLLCIGVGLYFAWVQLLAADAAAIRAVSTEQYAAGQAAAAWRGLPQFLLLALLEPTFWLGLAIIVVAPWLPLPGYLGGGRDVPPPDGSGRGGERRDRAAERTASHASPARASRKATRQGRATRVLHRPAPRA